MPEQTDSNAVFLARFPEPGQAKEFLDNVDRVIATAGTSTLDGNDVTFTAPTIDTTLGDIMLSAGYYGGAGTKLRINNGDFRTVVREY
ncbi:hypothetical protein ABIE52_000405 [Rhodococcus sp. OAS809]|uniref:hypothetical protein n=1 Tax=Rhodococcus sp. OAS809 TaxID=2663874 RepID=UPI00178A2D8A